MSALGHKRTFCGAGAMSALPPKADMCSALAHVRYVPEADIGLFSITLQNGREVSVSERWQN
jgi:hypothetical protein